MGHFFCPQKVTRSARDPRSRTSASLVVGPGRGWHWRWDGVPRRTGALCVWLLKGWWCRSGLGRCAEKRSYAPRAVYPRPLHVEDQRGTCALSDGADQCSVDNASTRSVGGV